MRKMELVGEVTDESEKAVKVRTIVEEGKTMEVWIPKALIEDRNGEKVVAQWKVKEKFGVDAVVKLAEVAEKKEVLREDKAVSKCDCEALSESIIERISTLSSIMKACNGIACELVDETIKRYDLRLTDKDKAELIEQYAVTLFIGARQSL